MIAMQISVSSRSPSSTLNTVHLHRLTLQPGWDKTKKKKENAARLPTLSVFSLFICLILYIGQWEYVQLCENNCCVLDFSGHYGKRLLICVSLYRCKYEIRHVWIGLPQIWNVEQFVKGALCETFVFRRERSFFFWFLMAKNKLNKETRFVSMTE